MVLVPHPCLPSTVSPSPALRTRHPHDHVIINARRARVCSTCPWTTICPQLPIPRKSSRSSLASPRNVLVRLGPAPPVLARTRPGFSRVPCSRTRPARTSSLPPPFERSFLFPSILINSVEVIHTTRSSPSVTDAVAALDYSYWRTAPLD